MPVILSFSFAVGLFLFRHVSAVHLSSPIVCPDIPRAANHNSISVESTDINLPAGSALLHGLTFNGSFLGPTITAVLGEDVSIDVVNNADIGEA